MRVPVIVAHSSELMLWSGMALEIRMLAFHQEPGKNHQWSGSHQGTVARCCSRCPPISVLTVSTIESPVSRKYSVQRLQSLFETRRPLDRFPKLLRQLCRRIWIREGSNDNHSHAISSSSNLVSVQMTASSLESSFPSCGR
jgi:hypothetical protein